MTSTAANGKSDKLLQQQNGAPNPNGAAANGVTSTTVSSIDLYFIYLRQRKVELVVL